MTAKKPPRKPPKPRARTPKRVTLRDVVDAAGAEGLRVEFVLVPQPPTLADLRRTCTENDAYMVKARDLGVTVSEAACEASMLARTELRLAERAERKAGEGK